MCHLVHSAAREHGGARGCQGDPKIMGALMVFQRSPLPIHDAFIQLLQDVVRYHRTNKRVTPCQAFHPMNVGVVLHLCAIGQILAGAEKTATPRGIRKRLRRSPTGCWHKKRGQEALVPDGLSALVERAIGLPRPLPMYAWSSMILKNNPASGSDGMRPSPRLQVQWVHVLPDYILSEDVVFCFFFIKFSFQEYS